MREYSESIDLLGAGETGFSDWFDLVDATTIRAAYMADVDAAPSGVIVQQSNDKVSVLWETEASMSALSTGDYATAFSIARIARYARVKATNGATPQTSSALHVVAIREG